jgi:hypothetical protein
MINAGNWFDYDVEEYLVKRNVKVKSFISDDELSPVAIEAMKQYIPNSSLIPMLIAGYEPPSIYQYTPVCEDHYDNDDDDIDNMPIHKQDGVDYSDIVADAKSKVSDAVDSFNDTQSKFDAWSQFNNSKKEENPPSK